MQWAKVSQSPVKIHGLVLKYFETVHKTVAFLPKMDPSHPQPQARHQSPHPMSLGHHSRHSHSHSHFSSNPDSSGHYHGHYHHRSGGGGGRDSTSHSHSHHNHQVGSIFPTVLQNITLRFQGSIGQRLTSSLTQTSAHSRQRKLFCEKIKLMKIDHWRPHLTVFLWVAL